MFQKKIIYVKEKMKVTNECIEGLWWMIYVYTILRIPNKKLKNRDELLSKIKSLIKE